MMYTLAFLHAPWCKTCESMIDNVPDWVAKIDISLPEYQETFAMVNGLPSWAKIDDQGKVLDLIQTPVIDTAIKWFNL